MKIHECKIITLEKHDVEDILRGRIITVQIDGSVLLIRGDGSTILQSAVAGSLADREGLTETKLEKPSSTTCLTQHEMIKEFLEKNRSRIQNLTKKQILREAGIEKIGGKTYKILNELLAEFNLKVKETGRGRKPLHRLKIVEGFVQNCPLGNSPSLPFCKEKCRAFVSAEIDDSANGILTCKGKAAFPGV